MASIELVRRGFEEAADPRSCPHLPPLSEHPEYPRDQVPPTVLTCLWCNETSFHDVLRPGMVALACYCSLHRTCKDTQRRQYQCLCRARSWEFRNQITRNHRRGVSHRVSEESIQVCTCKSCRIKGQGRHQKDVSETGRKRPRTEASPSLEATPAVVRDHSTIMRMFQCDFSLILSKLPRSFNLAVDEATQLRSDLLACAQFHIDLYLHSLPGRRPPPEWAKFGESMVPLLPSIGPQRKLTIARGKIGDPFSLLDRQLELISEDLCVLFGDVVAPSKDGAYAVPQFTSLDVVTVRIESHPHRFFLFQFTTTS